LTPLAKVQLIKHLVSILPGNNSMLPYPILKELFTKLTDCQGTPYNFAFTFGHSRMARSQGAQQQIQRRFSTPNLLFQSFLDDGPLCRTALEVPRPSGSSNVKIIHIEWLEFDNPPAHPQAQSSAQPRIEDVTSSTDPEVLNIAPRQHVCVVEMPSADDPDRIPNSHTDTRRRNSFNPNAPVITDVSTDINDE
jgi:hypothetical protein